MDASTVEDVRWIAPTLDVGRVGRVLERARSWLAGQGARVELESDRTILAEVERLHVGGLRTFILSDRVEYPSGGALVEAVLAACRAVAA